MASRYPLLNIYVVGLHLLIALLVFQHDRLHQLRFLLGVFPAEITPFNQQIRIYHRRMDASLPVQTTIFIGDSNTQGLAVSAVTPFAANYGIGEDTTAGVLQRLQDYPSLKRAQAVVLAIGINDLKRRSTQATAANMQRILQQLPPELPVLVSAVLPVDTEFGNGGTINREIRELNRRYQQIVENRTNTLFVDAYRTLADSEGELHSHYHIGDGLHLNTAGYAAWINQLNKALQQLNALTPLTARDQATSCEFC